MTVIIECFVWNQLTYCIKVEAKHKYSSPMSHLYIYIYLSGAIDSCCVGPQTPWGGSVAILLLSSKEDVIATSDWVSRDKVKEILHSATDHHATHPFLFLNWLDLKSCSLVASCCVSVICWSLYLLKCKTWFPIALIQVSKSLSGVVMSYKYCKWHHINVFWPDVRSIWIIHTEFTFTMCPIRLP